jgi:nucleoside-diphosphate-sugar epimerase
MNRADRTSTARPFIAGTETAELTSIVTGRTDSLFAGDLEASCERVVAKVRDRRILVIGGAGSIGATTVRLILDYQPSALHVVDHNENYLAELVRELRGRSAGIPDIDFHALPLDYGGPVMERLLTDSPPYDVVLNFAALKHVRSEKDIYSVLQMFDTNLVRHVRFKRWLAEHRHGATYFAVSTDKAANPVSLMGASKRLMEDLIFDVAAESDQSTTSARFANVAFSNGSLLQGFGYRLAKRQPLAVPRDTRRYFISQQEAGELCLLATCRIPDGHIAVPRLDATLQLQLLEDIACVCLDYWGWRAERYVDEAQARNDVERLAREGRWPLLLTPLDTGGEKSFEEFVGAGESAIDCGLLNVLALRHMSGVAAGQKLFEQIARWVYQPDFAIAKAEFVSAISAALPNFRHSQSEQNLDQRL